MKILQVIGELDTGGAEVLCLNLCKLFVKNNYDVKLIVFNKRGALINTLENYIDVIYLEKDKNAKKAKKVLINEIKEAEIVHVHMRHNYRFIKKTLLLARIKKKIILHDHYGKVALKKRVPTFFNTLYKPDYYIGCSKTLTDWASIKLSISKNKITYIKNFVIKENTEDFFEKKGFVLVGNLREVKNHIFAVKLAKALQMHLTIYSVENRDDYTENLARQIDEMGMTENVSYIYGCTNVQKELNKYQYALLPSKYEGDSLAIIEYLAQGIPFLCYDFGTSVSLLKEHLPFFVQSTFELDEWINSFNKIKKMDKADIDVFYNKFYSEEVFLKKYLKAYNQILDES